VCGRFARPWVGDQWPRRLYCGRWALGVRPSVGAEGLYCIVVFISLQQPCSFHFSEAMYLNIHPSIGSNFTFQLMQFSSKFDNFTYIFFDKILVVGTCFAMH